jgi:hypothetical protein
VTEPQRGLIETSGVHIRRTRSHGRQTGVFFGQRCLPTLWQAWLPWVRRIFALWRLLYLKAHAVYSQAVWHCSGTPPSRRRPRSTRSRQSPHLETREEQLPQMYLPSPDGGTLNPHGLATVATVETPKLFFPRSSVGQRHFGVDRPEYKHEARASVSGRKALTRLRFVLGVPAKVALSN